MTFSVLAYLVKLLRLFEQIASESEPENAGEMSVGMVLENCLHCRLRHAAKCGMLHICYMYMYSCLFVMHVYDFIDFLRHFLHVEACKCHARGWK